MCDIEKYVARCFKEKTKKSLKSAKLMFLFTFIAITIYLAFIVNEQIQMNNNFYNNRNTHIIDISHKQSDNGVVEISIDDVDKVKEIVKSTGKKAISSNKYLINFGINSTSRCYYICSLDDELYNKFGIEISEGISYSKSCNKETNITLNVPIITEQIGGYSSNESVEMNINVKPMTKEMEKYLSPNNDEIYVSKNIYKSIVEKMYKIDYNEFITRIEKGENFGIYPVERMWIYVDEFDDVKEVADRISKEGYEVSYTLDAFENLSQSLKTSKFIGFFILFAFLIITTFNMVMSIDSYLRNSQKDIGILMHYGYERNKVKNIYKQNLNFILKETLLITIMLDILVILFMVKQSMLINFIIVIGFVIVFINIVYFIISIRLNTYIKKDILELLKFSKENE